jgi:SOS response regulatory protein OraA/RecX
VTQVPTVTGLRERKRGRVAVELDSRPWRVLPTDAVVRAGLTVGRPLDRPTARDLARELRRARALTQAARLLAASGRSRQEIEQRLARSRHSGAAREEAVDALERAGVLDDTRLAEDRAELLARRGYGDAAIRADLRRRLIPAEAAELALAGLEPELARIEPLIHGQAVSPKLLRRLSGRGFSRDTIEEVASSFAQEA